jgi:imidazolonepropionase-like amidohydrolase
MARMSDDPGLTLLTKSQAFRAAREQIGYGPNLLKVYAHWGAPTLTIEEIRPIVEEVHKSKTKVAAHADSQDGIRNALTARRGLNRTWTPGRSQLFRVDETEECFLGADKGPLLLRRRHGEVSATTETHGRNSATRAPHISIARELGVKIANGFDPANGGEHSKNAHEIIAMRKLRLSPLEALRAATTNPAELIAWQNHVGSIESGKYADIIAVSGDPIADLGELEHVKFVMKGGTIVKNEFAIHSTATA